MILVNFLVEWDLVRVQEAGAEDVVNTDAQNHAATLSAPKASAARHTVDKLSR